MEIVDLTTAQIADKLRRHETSVCAANLCDICPLRMDERVMPPDNSTHKVATTCVQMLCRMHELHPLEFAMCVENSDF